MTPTPSGRQLERPINGDAKTRAASADPAGRARAGAARCCPQRRPAPAYRHRLAAYRRDQSLVGRLLVDLAGVIRRDLLCAADHDIGLYRARLEVTWSGPEVGQQPLGIRPTSATQPVPNRLLVSVWKSRVGGSA